MFFANHVQGKDPQKCADNDGHNVDTIDGLVPLIPITLSHLPSSSSAEQAAAAAALKKTSLTPSTVIGNPLLLPKYGEVFCGMIHASLLGQNLQETCEKAGAALGFNVKKLMQKTREDPMCACYIDSSIPTLLFYLHTYGENSPEEAMVRSTNAGGERGRGGVAWCCSRGETWIGEIAEEVGGGSGGREGD